MDGQAAYRHQEYQMMGGGCYLLFVVDVRPTFKGTLRPGARDVRICDNDDNDIDKNNDNNTMTRR